MNDKFKIEGIFVSMFINTSVISMNSSHYRWAKSKNHVHMLKGRVELDDYNWTEVNFYPWRKIWLAHFHLESSSISNPMNSHLHIICSICQLRASSIFRFQCRRRVICRQSACGENVLLIDYTKLVKEKNIFLIRHDQKIRLDVLNVGKT